MRSIAAICFLLIASAAEAGTITLNFGGGDLVLTTTARQDAAIARSVQDDNASRALRGLSAQSVEQFIRPKIIEDLRQLADVGGRMETTAACAKYNALAPAAKAQILTALGGDSPCQ